MLPLMMQIIFDVLRNKEYKTTLVLQLTLLTTAVQHRDTTTTLQHDVDAYSAARPRRNGSAKSSSTPPGGHKHHRISANSRITGIFEKKQNKKTL